MPLNIMTLSEMLCVDLVSILLLIVSSSIVAYDGTRHIEDGSHRDLASTDRLPEEPHQQWSVQPVSSPGCPEQCSCKKNDTHHIINVNCSSRGLTKVPDLPPTTVLLSLENNSISHITCDSFKHLRSLQDLNLASNKISHLPSCVFQSQSGYLLKLNISDNDIEYLDVELFRDLFQLKTVNLSVNIITYLANRTFSDLAQLVHLDLSSNHIKSIAPDAFKGLHSLKALSLLNNQLDVRNSSFHKDVFKDLVALEILDTRGNEGLLDNAISSVRNLTHLYMDLSHSTVKALGIGYRHLTNLQVLDVSPVPCVRRPHDIFWTVCYMPTIPSNFFDNIRTEKSFELYMSNCDVRNIENTFNALPTLVTLDLHFNPLHNFVESRQSWMASLINTSITSLDLSLTAIPVLRPSLDDSWFEHLVKTKLKALSLAGNNLDAILDFNEFPKTIEKLNMSENRLYIGLLYESFIFSDLTGSFNVRELDISNQNLEIATKQTSQEMPGANNFGHLSLGYGHFEIADGAGRTLVRSQLSDNDRVNSSQILNISPNQRVDSSSVGKTENESRNVWNGTLKSSLKEGDSAITDILLPAHLEVIYAKTSIYSDPTSITHIRVLNNTVLRHVDLSNNVLTSWQGPVENVPSLTILDLSRNDCDNVSVNFFKYMVSLETLILKKNFIGSSLAADVSGLTFSSLTNLKALDVSQNVIQDLSKLAFVNNANLETLDLSHNELTDFQPTLSTIHNLSFLDLSRNLLPGLSEQTSLELKLLKSRNNRFTVNLLNNRLLFTCDYLSFLDLLIANPHIFRSVESLKFKYINQTTFYYKDLAHHFPTLARECLTQRYFIVILIIFFIVVSTVTICAVIYHKRWKLRYLYYTSRRRMHIGEHEGDYVPAADVFITYDQDDLRWRRFMQQTFLPGLNQRNITYILGETDFPGGDLMAHVTGAVVGTRKTVVLLSADIFGDHHREFEMNLAIMREIDTRSLKIIPIFVEEVDLALYPREIEIFLRNQWERCHSYIDTDEFWDSFVDAVREDN